MKLHLVKSRNTGSGNVLTYRTDLNVGSFVYINEGEDNNSTSSSVGDDDYDSSYTSSYSADEVF